MDFVETERLENDNVFSMVRKIDSAETGKGYNINPIYYLKLIQEAAGLHSKLKKCTTIDLYKKYNYSWMILYNDVKIHKSMYWNDAIKVDTFIRPDRFISVRKCEGFDIKGKKVFDSWAYWAVVDLKEKKIIPVQDIANTIGTSSREFGDSKRMKKFSFEKDDKSLINIDSQTGALDIDFNNHVGNIASASYLLNFLPEYSTEKQNIVRMELLYEKEISGGKVPLVYKKEIVDNQVVWNCIMGDDALFAKIYLKG